jgi:hypothetical protein
MKRTNEKGFEIHALAVFCVAPPVRLRFMVVIDLCCYGIYLELTSQDRQKVTTPLSIYNERLRAFLCAANAF